MIHEVAALNPNVRPTVRAQEISVFLEALPFVLSTAIPQEPSGLDKPDAGAATGLVGVRAVLDATAENVVSRLNVHSPTHGCDQSAGTQTDGDLPAFARGAGKRGRQYFQFGDARLSGYRPNSSRSHADGFWSQAQLGGQGRQRAKPPPRGQSHRHN